ncbi:lactosylceramide 4-alpha-galactosyltransferase [Ixodes scapularis]
MNLQGKRPLVFSFFGPLVHRFKGLTQRIASAVFIIGCLVLFALHSGRVHPNYEDGGDIVFVETTGPRKSQPRNIFFLETSGRGNLTGRMSCAVESAALHHTEWTVSLLTAENSEKPESRSPFFDLLRRIPNVNIRSIKPAELLEGTPLSSWNFSGAMRSSPHRAVHLADVLRLAVVYKYGGVYLDLDIVMLRSLEDLHNCVSQTPTVSRDQFRLSYYRKT